MLGETLLVHMPGHNAVREVGVGPSHGCDEAGAGEFLRKRHEIRREWVSGGRGLAECVAQHIRR